MLSIKNFNRPIEVRGSEVWRFEDEDMFPQVVAFEVFRKLQLWRYVQIRDAKKGRGFWANQITSWRRDMNDKFPAQIANIPHEGWVAYISIEEIIREYEIQYDMEPSTPRRCRGARYRIRVDTTNYRYCAVLE